MVPLNQFLFIQNRLREVAQDKRVQILYACESGSRAWGFASQDSDYDVRFIYVHPFEWYLRVDESRDVIEIPTSEELDVSGWELRKALRLLRKSNPPLLEWFKSPVIYHEATPFLVDFKQLAADFYSPSRCFHHYLHMAQGNFRGYLQNDEVWLKKYLYVLRPLLSCAWIEKKGGPVPMLFDELVTTMVPNESLSQAITSLVDRKRSGVELTKAPRIPIISEFIETELARLEALPHEKEADLGTVELNRFFRKYCQP